MHPAPATDITYAAFAERRGAPLMLAIALFALRVAYLVWWCPFTLAEDEAQYWEWSRRLDWSYYSKGPGVAWAIAAATKVFGHAEWSVRLPAAASLLIVSLAGAALARDIFGSRRAAFFAVALLNCVPLLQSAGLLMTIDMPYAACWTLAAWAFWRGVTGASGPALVGAGAAIGVGFLFKYTALLLVPGFVIFAIARRRRLSLPRAPWFAVAAIVLAVCAAPVLYWNWIHEWPTVKHLLGHVNAEGGDRPVAQRTADRPYSIRWTLEYIGAQIGLAGPMIGLAIVEFFDSRRRRAEEPRRWNGSLYLALCALPLLVFYLLVTFVAPVQQNWALAAHTTLAVMGAGVVVRGMDDYARRLARWRSIPPPRPRAGVFLRRPETLVQVLWHVTLAFGIVTGIGFARADLAAHLPLIGRAVPIHRLTGADVRAGHVARLLAAEQLAAGDALESRYPFVIAHLYGPAAQMAYYLPGRPVVYCSSAYDGGRRTQYDYFPDTDLERVTPQLLGRSAVMIGGTEESWRYVFDSVTPVGKLEGEKKDDRPAFTGRGFRGFPRGRTAP